MTLTLGPPWTISCVADEEEEKVHLEEQNTEAVSPAFSTDCCLSTEAPNVF